LIEGLLKKQESMASGIICHVLPASNSKGVEMKPPRKGSYDGELQ